MSTDRFTYVRTSACNITPHMIAQCAKLFSEHYGIWADHENVPVNKRGKPIKLAPKRLHEQYLFDDCCFVVTVWDHDTLIGHCCGREFDVSTLGMVCWITQLVVHSDYRHRGLATRLLFMARGPYSRACGLVTSNPFAIKALEKSMHQKCQPEIIQLMTQSIINDSKIPYLQQSVIVDHTCLVNTRFFVDHTQIIKILIQLTDNDTWTMGTKLPDGFEFVALIVSESTK